MRWSINGREQLRAQLEKARSSKESASHHNTALKDNSVGGDPAGRICSIQKMFLVRVDVLRIFSPQILSTDFEQILEKTKKILVSSNSYQGVAREISKSPLSSPCFSSFTVTSSSLHQPRPPHISPVTAASWVPPSQLHGAAAYRWVTETRY